jgi:4-amino-4-deoxy-L-arabinose transferase-like glycosyltransferase
MYSLATYLVLAYALRVAFKVYAFAFDRPILGQHEFRQAQTALSAWSIASGGPWFAYETPVFGAPYAIPFEFPLYQWIVVVVHLCGVPLDQAGRYVSIGFFLLLLLPFFRLMRSFDLPVNVSLLTVAMLVSAPLYMFWTRAFMIESAALCFAIASLAIGVEALDDRTNPRRLTLLFALASLAMLIKITTGIIYLAILGLLLLGRVATDPERRTAWKGYLSFVLAGFLLPTLIGVGWAQYTELLRTQNALTANFLSSKALHDWFYGTWQQKMSLETWRVFWDRTAWYGFGTGTSLAAGLALAVFGTKKPGALAACLLSVLGAFALFTNLHWFHDYYQYATTVLAILAVGFGFAAAERWTPRARWLLPLLTAAIVLKSSAAYDADYRQLQLGGDEHIVEVGKFIQAHTHEAALIVVYGNDWSSVLPYYARRRALTNRWNHPPSHPDMVSTLKRSAALGNRVEAVVFCYGDRHFSDGRAAALLGHAPSCRAIGACDVCL